MKCTKCGINEQYERNGRIFKLCASCAWENLEKLLFEDEDENGGMFGLLCKCKQPSPARSAPMLCMLCGGKIDIPIAGKW